MRIARWNEVAEKMRIDHVKTVDISTMATVSFDDGSLRDPLGKSPLVKVSFKSGDVLIAEIA